MTIIEVIKNKKQFLSLLLLADEQENMIDRYLERGTMYVLNDNGVKAECVVTDECNGILEIKNMCEFSPFSWAETDSNKNTITASKPCGKAGTPCCLPWKKGSGAARRGGTMRVSFFHLSKAEKREIDYGRGRDINESMIMMRTY